MVKKMAEKKKVITEVLSCLVVCMFLMSVVPVSIFAMNSGYFPHGSRTLL